ncbi:MAG: hypothetical protein WCA20_06195 [Candidatus Sulfotelmatobacter sp.]
MAKPLDPATSVSEVRDRGSRFAVVFALTGQVRIDRASSRALDSDGSRNHRDSEQPDFIAEPFGGDRLWRRNRVLLGLRHRQLNFDLLLFTVELFDQKIGGFAD